MTVEQRLVSIQGDGQAAIPFVLASGGTGGAKVALCLSPLAQSQRPHSGFHYAPSDEGDETISMKQDDARELMPLVALFDNETGYFWEGAQYGCGVGHKDYDMWVFGTPAGDGFGCGIALRADKGAYNPWGYMMEWPYDMIKGEP